MITDSEHEHQAILKDTGLFESASLKRQIIDKGIAKVTGKLKDSGFFVTQSYRINKQIRTPFQAQEWLKKNKIHYKSFEEAKVRKFIIPVQKETKDMEKIITIKKIDEHKRIVSCVVLEPRTQDNPDLQGDYYTQEDIEKAMTTFVENGMAHDQMHDGKVMKSSDVFYTYTE